MATEKALILLQENSGALPFDISLPEFLKQQLTSLVDSFAETFEDLKTSVQARGKYKVIHHLTDNACTRAKLVEALVAETKKGRIIDLLVLGHGLPEELVLNNGPNLTGGKSGTIRTLLPDAKKKGVTKLNLRLVFMCNCYGSTVNDDWLKVGARVSIGSRELDMMPEPMTTFFLQNWLGGQSAQVAATGAYESTIPFYTIIYPPSVKIRHKTVEIKYPCPSLTNPLRLCRKKLDLPAGADLTPHTYVKQTELLVGGDGKTKF